MAELISAPQAGALISIASIVVMVLGGAWGCWRFGLRGLSFCVPGLMIAPLWQMHLWFTRYNLRTGVLGLTSLKVLLGELVFFIVLGMLVGWFFSCALRVPSGKSARGANGE